MADGTRCYKGPSCKRHGTQALKAASAAKAQELQSQISALLAKPPVVNLEANAPIVEASHSYPPLPEWWNEHQQKNFGYTEEIFQKFGLKNAFVPTFHDSAMDYSYIGVETGDKETQLVVNTDGSYYKQGEKYYCRAWMYKEGKPVAMLRFATFPEGYTPPEGQYPYTESVICDIEVNEAHTGKGYAMEIIRNVEKNVLGGRLIHSGGSYTPEGRKSLGGKLPYTHEAQKEHKKEFEAGSLPAPSYDSMKFVHDWDMLQTIS